MKIARILLLIAPLILTGCPKPEPNVPDDPDPGPEPNIVVKDDRDLCEKSCDHVQMLGCPEGNKLIYPGSCETDDDCSDGPVCTNGQCIETCTMVCEGLVDQGRQLGLECWQTISQCEEIETLCR